MLETFPAGDPAWEALFTEAMSKARSGAATSTPRRTRSRRGAALEAEAMSQVVATAERSVRAPREQVLTALADYEVIRPRLRPEQFGD